MHIFIDESGRFANPGKKDEALSVVGALCIPDTRLDALYERFGKLKQSWGAGDREIKGIELNETQLRDTLILLKKGDAKATFVMTDLGLQSTSELRAHQERQADNFTKHLTEAHPPDLVADLNDLRNRILKLSMPLYVQMILLTHLVIKATQVFTLWHATRDGRELGQFHWVVDPKDMERTEYEKIWRLFVLPAVKDDSRLRPLYIMEDGGDYSAFARFMRVLESRPDSWPSMKPGASGPTRTFDLRLILMEDFRYLPSKDNLGLQMADIVVSNLRRALLGRMGARGWEPLAGLTIRGMDGTLDLIRLGPARGDEIVQRSYSDAVNWINMHSSSILPPRLRRK